MIKVYFMMADFIKAPLTAADDTSDICRKCKPKG